MYFEVSARAGTNITLCFNELAKKLTGIETNPIQQSELKNNGFVLGQQPSTTDGGATTEGGKKGKKKGKCC